MNKRGASSWKALMLFFLFESNVQAAREYDVCFSAL